jgi:hypothetical protein
MYLDSTLSEYLYICLTDTNVHHTYKPVLRIRIWNPGFGAFFTPGVGMAWVKKIKIRIRDEHPGSYFLELRNQFLG